MHTFPLVSGEKVNLCPVSLETPCDDWEYFALPKSMNVKLIPQGDGHFEFAIKVGTLIILLSPRTYRAPFQPGPYAVPSVFNTVVDGERAYATGDLVIPHPSEPGFIKIYGRVDDQIVHSSGKKVTLPLTLVVDKSNSISPLIPKTNPGPLGRQRAWLHVA